LKKIPQAATAKVRQYPGKYKGLLESGGLLINQDNNLIAKGILFI
jgi:hypothetical protein